MFRYSFVTCWKVKAKMDEVWNAIYDTDHWPEWWKGVEEVKQIQCPNSPCLHQITTRSNYDRPVSFNLRITSVEKNKFIKAETSGEFKGKAIWEFEEQSDGTIMIKYKWNAIQKTSFKNLLSPISSTILQWHHDTVMQWGAKGLANKLHAGLIEY